MDQKEWKVLVIGDRLVTNQLFQKAIDRQMEKSGHRVAYKFLENRWPEEPLGDIEEVHEAAGDVAAILRQVEDVEIIVTDMAPITKRVLDAAAQLKLIAISRGGPTSVNLRAAAEKNIPVVNVPGRSSQAVAEFTLGLILTQMKGITQCHMDLKRKIWRRDLYCFENAPRELKGQKVGLIGLGTIGRLLVPMLQGLSLEVTVYDPFIRPRVLKKHGTPAATLEAVLQQSDVVSLHARATAENVGLIGQKQLRIMKPSAYLINTARGALIDYPALYRALQEHWIAGAALDVYDTEPVDLGSPLLELENVTFTPHVAGLSREMALRSAEGVASEIGRFIRNEAFLLNRTFDAKPS